MKTNFYHVGHRYRMTVQAPLAGRSKTKVFESKEYDPAKPEERKEAIRYLVHVLRRDGFDWPDVLANEEVKIGWDDKDQMPHYLGKVRP